MINEKDFQNALDEVVKDEDKIIVLYSGIYSFIYNLNFKNNGIKYKIEKILNIIENKIGKKKTLFLPSFSGKFYSEHKYFDLRKTIDDSNGVISKLALKRKYFRTHQPIHSYLVFGNTSLIKKTTLKSSWGKNSLLEFFSKKNARICNLGLEWNKGCAYLHRFEEIYKVPWRYNKKFTCDLITNGRKIGKCSEIKYCSSIKRPLNYDYKPFIKEIENSKTFCKSKNKYFKFESIKVSCLDKIGKKLFSKNPWIIIKNKKRTKYWIKHEKNNEMLNLND